jgi:integrase/recombinase XerD
VNPRLSGRVTKSAILFRDARFLSTGLGGERSLILMHRETPPRVGSLYSDTGQRKYLTGDERARFLAAAAEYKRPEIGTLCLLMAHTGCRISEALALTPMNLEADAGFIAIRCLKKRSRAAVIREVPAPPCLFEALARVHGQSDHACTDRLWTLSRCRAWRLIKDVMTAAVIPPGLHATPKGLRHGFGVHAIRSGIPLNLVQRWMGHASMTTTAIYLQVIGAEEHEIAERMWH